MARNPLATLSYPICATVESGMFRGSARKRLRHGKGKNDFGGLLRGGGLSFLPGVEGPETRGKKKRASGLSV